tara:strand:+ start:219 stop:560 length:342 start_codon:yes stop_codon:yes gene_type:complete
MKPLLVEILESILRTDGNLAYTIDCEEEQLVSLTRDTSLACNQKEGDKSEGVDAVDEARIEIWENQNDEYIGFIYWTNFNDGVERASDYSVVLDEKYGLNKTLDDWEKKYELL